MLIAEQWIKGTRYRFEKEEDGSIMISKTQDLKDFLAKGHEVAETSDEKAEWVARLYIKWRKRGAVDE